MQDNKVRNKATQEDKIKVGEGTAAVQEENTQEDRQYTSSSFMNLVEIVSLLRSEQGCPWDREQTHESIAKNMIEEAYEVVDAIESRKKALDEADTAGLGKVSLLKEELGDVLLQVLLHAQIARDNDEFTLDELINGITAKLVRRHPHVFGDVASFKAAGLSSEEVALVKGARNAEATIKLWDRMKMLEQTGKESREKKHFKKASLLSSVPQHEPALMQAQNISRKVAARGFDWSDMEGLANKLAEEFEEYAACEPGSAEAEEEFGDILFTLVNIARWDGIDAESALRCSCRKFRTRWQALEQRAQEEDLDLLDLDEYEWEDLWAEAKAKETVVQRSLV